MKKSARIYRDAVAIFIAAALVACGGGFHTAGSLIPTGGSAPRHAMSWGLATTQPLVDGTMVIPLTLGVSGSVGTFSAFGTAQCAAPSGTNPCPNIAYASSPPSWIPSADTSLTFASSTIGVGCSSSCYVVAYENGAGPYLVQGPGSAASSTSVAFGAETVARYFLSGTTYSFFLAHVTAVNTPPPPPTPSPSPVPTATPTASACATSSPSGGIEDDVRRANDDDEEGGSCATPSPRPTATCATEDDATAKHHGGAKNPNKAGDDDECDDD